MSNSKEKLNYLDILVLSLSVYVLGALLVDTFFELPEEISKLIDIFDHFICLVFFYDFAFRFYNASNKWKFLRWGWIDLLSSIPAIDFFRVGRAFRLIRLFRILRAFRSTKNLVHYIFRNRKQGAFTSVSIIAILMIIFSSIAILQMEDTADGNIKTAEDALWWAYVTITTVGYGDKYPVTIEGKIIAAALMTAGVGLFGTFTGYVASWFLDDRQKNEKENK